MKPRPYYPIALITVLLFALCVAAPGARPQRTSASETPVWSNDFVDSIGENTHCTFARIGWVDCKNWRGAQAAIETLGLRHIRDGISDYWNGYNNSGSPHIPSYREDGKSTPVSTFYNRLADHGNVKYDFVVGLRYGNHAPYVNAVKAAVPSTEALELGGNEPDSPYNSPIDICPSPNPNGLSCWYRDATAQIKFYSSYAKAAGLIRVGPSVEYGKNYNCSNVPGSQKVVLSTAECPTNGAPNLSVFQIQAGYIDAVNLHSYVGEKHPGTQELGSYKSTAQTYVPIGTSWVTETGYGTGRNGNTDLRIAKYEPRIFTEAFFEGIDRTYQFEMFDQVQAAAGKYFDTFGLLSVNEADLTLTPKPQYEALRSLIQIMNDPGERPQLKPLAYSIDGGDSKLHHILALRRDGTYQLMMWIEGADPTPAESVKLTFCEPRLPIGRLSQFTPENGQYANSSLKSTTSGGCVVYGPLNVTDALQIYRFGATAFNPVTPLPKATPFTTEAVDVK